MTGHIGPDCCCEVPCKKPIVTCTLIDNNFHYEIEHATSGAYIFFDECGEGGIPATMNIDVDENGNASGDYDMTGVDCNACVVASSPCAETICCQDCIIPSCNVTAQKIYDEPIYRVTYYIASDHGGNNLPANNLATATLNGSSLTITPGSLQDVATGFIDYDTENDFIPETFTVTGTTVCGRQCTKTLKVPCCLRIKTEVHEIVGVADVEKICNFSWPGYVNVTIRNTLSGLSGFNGTFLRDYDNTKYNGCFGFDNLLCPVGMIYTGNSVTVTVYQETTYLTPDPWYCGQPTTYAIHTYVGEAVIEIVSSREYAFWPSVYLWVDVQEFTRVERKWGTCGSLFCPTGCGPAPTDWPTEPVAHCIRTYDLSDVEACLTFSNHRCGKELLYIGESIRPSNPFPYGYTDECLTVPAYLPIQIRWPSCTSGGGGSYYHFCSPTYPGISKSCTPVGNEDSAFYVIPGAGHRPYNLP